MRFPRLTFRRLRTTALIVFLVLFGKPLWLALVSPPSWIFEPDADALLVDGAGDLVMTWPEYGDRRLVAFDDLPEHLVNAATAREDQRFWKHPGIDPKGLARAALVDFKKRSLSQGGSTITMQLVERVYRYPQDSRFEKIRAKFFELIMAPKLEIYAFVRAKGSLRESKGSIMSAYLSRVEYGHRTVGIREAAHCYFGKDVAKLNLGESAYLAGLIRGPSANNAYYSQDNARLARDAVVANMERLGHISAEEADRVSFYVGSRPNLKSRRGDGFLSAAVKRELDDLVADGLVPPNVTSANRVKISLALDDELQSLARAALLKRIREIELRRDFKSPRGKLQGAVVAIDNRSGAVIASVGGRGFDHLSFDCAFQAQRTVASTGKPFLFASLMDSRNLSPQALWSNHSLTSLSDRSIAGPLAPRETQALKSGEHPLWKGLAYSSNRMAMQVGAGVRWDRWNG
ncbi:MAG: transglycosylase domain-containing protein, partial [Planctomycetota bacterium]